jgi:hypothetical protein
MLLFLAYFSTFISHLTDCISRLYFRSLSFNRAEVIFKVLTKIHLCFTLLRVGLTLDASIKIYIQHVCGFIKEA